MTSTGRVRDQGLGRGWVRGRFLARALGLALGSFALLAGSALANGPEEGADASAKPVKTIVHKDRNFRIPITIEPEVRAALREVQLWVSLDGGYHWKRSGLTTPDRPAFTFRSNRDGEYLFALRTLDKNGRLNPGENDQVEPSLKVIVDTVPPSVIVEPEGRRGSYPSVRWEVRDDHLDMRSLRIEYQVVGGRDWRQIPIRRPGLIGRESWDAGTVEPLKVRASVSDLAGNVAQATIDVAEGYPVSTGLTPGESPEFAKPSPIAQMSTDPGMASAANPNPGSIAPNPDDPFNLNSTTPPSPTARPEPTPVEPEPGSPAPFGPAAGSAGANPLPPAIGSTPSPVPTTPDTAAPSGPAPAGDSSTIVVGTPKFPLQYAVEDDGPNGPATVELWVTLDGGRTWLRRGEDPDKKSPLEVNLGGEGTFGLRTVARAATGLGDLPPAPGDQPHVWVEVDTSPPQIQLNAPVVGVGTEAGKVTIAWRASDSHFGPKPIQISWKSDQPGAHWQPVTGSMENTGKFVWNVPLDVPARFFLRLDAIDTVGNRAFVESPETAPVIVDRTRPKSRIIGLDPSVRSGMGPNARPLR